MANEETQTTPPFVIFLEQERAARKLTQREFARVLGVAVSTYNKLVHEVHSPDLETLDKIARGLNTSLARLIEICGYDLTRNANLSPSTRIQALVAWEPRLTSVAPLLQRLNPSELVAVLGKLEQDFGMPLLEPARETDPDAQPG